MAFTRRYKWLRSSVIALVCTTLIAVTTLADDTPSTTPDTPTAEVSALGTDESLPGSEIPTLATDEPVLATDIPAPTETSAPTSTDVPETPDVSPTVTATDTPVEETPLATLEVSASPVVPSPIPVTETQTVIFPAAYSTNFESGLPSELLFEQIWSVVEMPDGHAIQSSDESRVLYRSATFVEGSVDASFDVNQGTGGLVWGAYSASLAADDTLTLAYDGTVMQTTAINQPNLSWNNLRLTVTTSTVTVAINDIDTLSIAPVAPLLPVQVGFWSGTASAVRVDDFALFGAPIAEPVTPVVSESPTPELSLPAAPVANLSAPLAAPSQPVITSPLQGDLVTSVRPTIVWEAVANATSYEVAIFDYDAGVDYGTYTVVAATEFTVPENLPQHWFGFSVRAENNGDWSDWTSVGAFVMLGEMPPYNGEVPTTQPTFTWPAVVGATSYTLQIDNDLNFTTPLLVRTTSDLSYTLTSAEALPQLNATYYWRMSASNVAYPPYGYVRIFSVSVPVPDAPVITSPLPWDLTTSVRPTITWEAVADATGYEVWIVDNDTGTDYGIYPVSTGTQFTVPENLPQHYFNFAVRSERNGALSDWAVVNAFVMLGETPLNNGMVTTTQPTFTWPAVAGATSYTLQIGNGGDFNPPLIVHTTSDTSYTLTGAEALQDLTTYHWRMLASNVAAPPYGYVRVFSVNLTAEWQPVMTSPLEGDLTTSVRPTMTWNAVTDVTGYEVHIVDNDAGIDYGTYAVSDTQFTVPENLPQHLFSFSVRAQRDEVWSAWTTVNAFVMLGETPAYNSTVTTTRPTFTWPAVDGATSYTLEIDDDVDFATPLVEHTVTGTSYTLTPAEALPYPNTTYTWRMSASNVATPPYGYLRIFYVGDVEPETPVGTPVITSPIDAEVLATVRPTITWDAVTDATHYEVSITDNITGLTYGAYQVETGTQFTLPENLPQHLFSFSVRAGHDSTWGEWTSVSAYIVLGDTPQHETIIETTRPTFTWVAVPGATSYTLQIDDDTDFTTPLVERTVTGTSYTLTTAEMLPNSTGYYYWRLSASNIEYPPYGYERHFRVNVAAPAQPIITSPASESTLGTVRPTIIWDAVADAVGYEVAFVDPITGSDYAPHQSVTGTQYKPAYNLPQGDVDVYVRARSEIAWSGWTYLRLRIVLGNTPAYESIVTTTRPALKWTSVPGASNYTLQVDDNADFSSPFIERTINGTSYTPTAAEALPTLVIRYYWRVSASNLAYPEATLARTFINGATSAPTNLVASREGETTPATLFGAGMIQFRWDAPTPTPYGYEVQYSSTSDFSSIILQPTSLDPSMSFEGFYLPEGKIYWRVRTIYNPEFVSIGKWSGSKSFTIDLTAPAAPVLTAPAGVIHKARPAFSWHSVSGASSYTLSVYDAVTNAPVSGFPRTITGTSYTILNSELPLQQGDYYWHVSAADAVGNISYPSADSAFTIFSGLTPTPGQSLTDTTPRFTWQSVGGTGAAAWRLEIGTSAQMDTLVYTSADLAASATSFTLPNANALPIGTYYWRVYRVTGDTSLIPGQSLSIVAP